MTALKVAAAVLAVLAATWVLSVIFLAVTFSGLAPFVILGLGSWWLVWLTRQRRLRRAEDAAFRERMRQRENTRGGSRV